MIKLKLYDRYRSPEGSIVEMYFKSGNDLCDWLNRGVFTDCVFLELQVK